LQHFKLIYTRQTISHLPIANKQSRQTAQSAAAAKPSNITNLKYTKSYSYNTNQKSKSWMQKLKEQAF
jgi:hypothetical protein